MDGGPRAGVPGHVCGKPSSRVVFLGGDASGVEVPGARGFALPHCFERGAGETGKRARCKGKEGEEEEMKTN